MARFRWAWFVMFVIVWLDAFPILVFPVLRHRWSLSFTEWICSALFQSGIPRVWAMSVIIFILMLIALFLPIKSFFLEAQQFELTTAHESSRAASWI
jgi:hypothetical protein